MPTSTEAPQDSRVNEVDVTYGFDASEQLAVEPGTIVDPDLALEMAWAERPHRERASVLGKLAIATETGDFDEVNQTEIEFGKTLLEKAVATQKERGWPVTSTDKSRTRIFKNHAESSMARARGAASGARKRYLRENPEPGIRITQLK